MENHSSGLTMTVMLSKSGMLFLVERVQLLRIKISIMLVQSLKENIILNNMAFRFMMNCKCKIKFWALLVEVLGPVVRLLGGKPEYGHRPNH